MNNLSYETAKKLKEAGFPQNNRGSGNWYDDETGEPSPHMLLSSRRDHDLTKCSYVPSLSELIDAMPMRMKYLDGLINSGFFYLMKMCGSEPSYRAYIEGESGEGIIEPYNFVAKTPEEAVANLYIALHNK